MHVVATAGHVDHGKSTLVRALTGTDPDRLAEERRRGLTIELGYASAVLPGVGDVAFVDVPGHERFVPTMLAGVGPVPAVLFVVAADDPWMPQAAEHLAALDALAVRHAVVAITRSDLTDPAEAGARARAELGNTTLAGAPVVAVSSRTGAGLDDLRSALAAMLRALPVPPPTADVRLWVDRRFTVAGTGTVVTGTLPAGTIRVGDRLTDGTSTVRIRGLQLLHAAAQSATGTARVACALSGDVERDSVLVAPDLWPWTELVDVRVQGELPERPILHVGSVSVGCRMRPLGSAAARLQLERTLPLRPGDRLLLRDPGSRRLWGGTVVDPEPPPLARRGDARRRAAVLERSPDELPSLPDELRRRPCVSQTRLRRFGVDLAGADAFVVRAGDWMLDRALVPELGERIRKSVAAADSLDAGVAAAALAHELDIPMPLVEAVTPPDLVVRDGRVRLRSSGLPERVSRAVDALLAGLASPFDAPPRDRLAALGLDRRAVAAAGRAGCLLVLDEGVVLAPGADAAAVAVLARLPQPFTASEARQALGSSRRVVLPLLELLDRSGRTLRLPDDRRRLR